jgi:hypothetical protein
MQKKPLIRSMIKALRKLGIEEMYFNILKAICDKPPSNVILNGEKLKAFPLKSGTRQGCPTVPTPIQHSPGIPSQEIRQEEEIKGI